MYILTGIKMSNLLDESNIYLFLLLNLNLTHIVILNTYKHSIYLPIEYLAIFNKIYITFFIHTTLLLTHHTSLKKPKIINYYKHKKYLKLYTKHSKEPKNWKYLCFILRKYSSF